MTILTMVTILGIVASCQQKRARMDNPPQVGRSKTPTKAKRYRTPKVLEKTNYQRLNELKDLILSTSGSAVVKKVVDIALNDDHPGQMAALKLCLERTLPVSMFEKDKNHRGAVTINITGIGEVTTANIIDVEEPEDAEEVT